LGGLQTATTDFWNGEKMNRKSAALITFLVLTTLSAFGASSGYHLLKKVSIPGAGGWDYVTVDAAARRVYISHATQVEIIDADTNEIVGKIPGTPGVHGVALAQEFSRGFITAAKGDAVIIFDLKTLKTIGQVKVGKKPDAIIYDPATKRVFAMNGDGDSTTAINAAVGTIDGTVDLGGGPEFSAVDGKGNLYVNLEEENLLVHIDTQGLKVKDRWPVAPCQAPSSMAFDAQSRRLFLGCRSNVMAVVDADNGKVVATYPIGDHVDASFFDPATKLVLHSLGEGNVAVFHQDSADKYSFVENVATNKGSKTMGFDPKTHHLFVPSNQQGAFTILVLGQ
jgi:DNA-binding beta-propeller fold protein YncE